MINYYENIQINTSLLIFLYRLILRHVWICTSYIYITIINTLTDPIHTRYIVCIMVTTKLFQQHNVGTHWLIICYLRVINKIHSHVWVWHPQHAREWFTWRERMRRLAPLFLDELATFLMPIAHLISSHVRFSSYYLATSRCW